MDLDAPDALIAFQAAIVRSRVPESAHHDVVQASKAMALLDTPESPEEEGLSIKPEESLIASSTYSDPPKTVVSGVIKCLKCGHEMNQILTTSAGNQTAPKSSSLVGHNDADNRSHSVVSHFEEIKPSLKEGSKPSAPSAAKAAKSITSSVVHAATESSHPPRSTTPIPKHTDSNLAANDLHTPLNRGWRVPQNSMANIASVSNYATVAPLENSTESFTTEEAHDVMITIFRELADLSDRVQAENSSAKESKLSAQSHQPRSIDRKSSEVNLDELESQATSSKLHQPGSIFATSELIKNEDGEASGSNVNLPPHLRTNGQPTERVLEPSIMKQIVVPPHLLSPEPHTVKPHRAHATGNYFSVLDPGHQPSLSPNINRSGNENSSNVPLATEYTHPVAENLSSFTPTTDTSIVLSRLEKDKTVGQPRQVQNSSSWALATTGKDLDRGMSSATIPGSVTRIPESQETQQNFEKGYSTSNLSHANGKASSASLDKPFASIPQLGLPLSFLEKYSYKPRSVPPKTINSNTGSSEDLEHQVVFKAWPGQEARARPAAGVRTCYIKDIPTSATPAFVCNLVFGGPLERVKLHIEPSNSMASASIRFTSSDACQTFYEATANGLLYQERPGSPKRVAWVTLGKDVDVIGGLLADQIDQGVTRCVRAIPVDLALKSVDLFQLASAKGRQLEGLEDGKTKNGSRSVVWRFCDMAHAAAFRGVLARDELFESCNISFSEDPCALRDSVKELL